MAVAFCLFIYSRDIFTELSVVRIAGVYLHTMAGVTQCQ